MIGEVSLAFAVPFLVALWAFFRPAPVGAIGMALASGSGRSLAIEASCVVGLLLLAIASMFVSDDPYRAFRVIFPMLYAICALVILARVPVHLRFKLLYALLFAGVVALGIALLMTQTSGRLVVMRDYRMIAFFENPNQLGVMFLGVWPLALAMLMVARSIPSKLLCLGMVAILVAVTFLSGTKTALALGFASAALMWFYHASRSGSINKAVFKIAVVASIFILSVPALLWVVSWANPSFMLRVDAILEKGVWQFPSMKTRGEVWMDSFQTGLEHPVLGVGAGTRIHDRSHSHNIFFDYFRGMGIFGGIAAAILMASVFLRGFGFILTTWHKGMQDRSSDIITAGLYMSAVFYLIANQLSDTLSPTTAFLFWMMYIGAYLAASSTLTVARPEAHTRAGTLSWTARQRDYGPVGHPLPTGQPAL